MPQKIIYSLLAQLLFEDKILCFYVFIKTPLWLLLLF